MKVYAFSKVRQWSCFVVGVGLCGLGAALCTRPELGTSPIAAPAYAVTFLSPLSFGTWTFLLNALFLLGQMAILGRHFQLFQLVQLVASLLLSIAIDVGMWVSGFWIPLDYLGRLLELILGCGVTAVGIAMEIAAGTTYLPGDGLIQVIVKRWRLNFGMVKISFDIVLVLWAALIGWLGVGKLHGIREGTFLAAFLVGWLIKLLQKPTRRLRKCLLIRKRLVKKPESY